MSNNTAAGSPLHTCGSCSASDCNALCDVYANRQLRRFVEKPPKYEMSFWITPEVKDKRKPSIWLDKQIKRKGWDK